MAECNEAPDRVNALTATFATRGTIDQPMAHDESYEVTPARLDRSSHRRASAAAASIVLFLGLVVVKPWAGSSDPEMLPSAPARAQVAAAAARPAGPVPNVAAVARPVVIPVATEAGWPAATNGDDINGRSASQAEEALGSLTVYSGRWGVGNAGLGPRLLRDEPWFDWAAVVPEASSDPPNRIVIWPGTSLCAGYPTIYDRPTFVAVTAPTDLAQDWRLVGWWTDGGRVASLDGSVRQIPSTGSSGISYLERVDGAPWPSGRYEFHVIAGERTVALTVCLTRRG